MSNAVSVSMIRLISNPDKYNNKNIIIVGFVLPGQGDDVSVFFDEISASRLLFDNSISIKKGIITKKDLYLCKNKYCVIEGLFSIDMSGPWGLTSGGFIKINRIFPNINSQSSVSERP